MDIQLPVMDGLKATKILKSDSKTKNIPILALTSYAMKGDMERIMQVGCDAYLAKPIDVRELLATVARLLST